MLVCDNTSNQVLVTPSVFMGQFQTNGSYYQVSVVRRCLKKYPTVLQEGCKIRLHMLNSRKIELILEKFGDI